MSHDLPTGDRDRDAGTQSGDGRRSPGEVVSLAAWASRQTSLPASRIVPATPADDSGDRDFLTEAIQLAERRAPAWLLPEQRHLEVLWAKIVPILRDYDETMKSLERISRLL